MVKRSIYHKLRLRNFDARHEKSTHVQWSGIERERVALKEERVFVTSGKKKTSVRRETNAVSGERVTVVRNRHRKPKPPSEPQFFKKRGKASREKVLRNSIDRFVNTCISSHCEYWHPLERRSAQRNRDVSFGAECPFPHGKVAEQQKQSRKK